MKLAELIVKNFRGIGEPVRIKIDEIVVLIGNNNVGKTTILKAYEAFASAGKALSIRDFYLEKTNYAPIITGVFVDVTAKEDFSEKWIHDDEDLGYKDCIKVQYRWDTPNAKGQKYSFNPETGIYEKGGMGGFDSILTSRIPTPLTISPLDDPKELEKNILAILTEAIKERTKEDSSSLEDLLNQIEDLAEEVQKEIQEDIDYSTQQVSEELEKVFPEFNKVEIDAKPGKLEPEKLINAGSFVRIGSTEENRHMTPLTYHGTGLQRTFLWAALKMLADTGRHKVGRKAVDAKKPKILLIEEPEAFLHPHAIKEARNSLYEIAKLSNWQVMTTTHSPIFIDLTKDHTTIIRLEKNKNTKHTVKTFTTTDANFTNNDKENLKMLNYCNPYFNEFFFAHENLLVEGETEYTVVKSVLEKRQLNKDLHVINCFGKANIVTVSKILNHFSVPYSILHDSDCPKAKRKSESGYKYIQNAAWTLNKRIIEVVDRGREKGININTFLSVPEFEDEFMGDLYIKDSPKPYTAWKYFQNDESEGVKKFTKLIGFLNDGIGEPSQSYRGYTELVEKVEEYIDSSMLESDPLWEIDRIKV